MKESLHRLLELQEIDKEIGTLERSKEEFPDDQVKAVVNSAARYINA